MKVLILGYRNRAGVAETIDSLRPFIQKYAEIVLEDLTGLADLSQVKADLALVFGGDGSILRAVQQMGTRQLPVLSVNLGRLGFLAGLSRNDDLTAVLRHFSDLENQLGASWLVSLRNGSGGQVFQVPQGGEQENESKGPLKERFRIASHRLLEAKVTFHVGSPEEKTISSLFMNETAIQSADFHIIDVGIWGDEDFLTSCLCDGLILSTPIGSTAHNLSVGGPILRPGLEAVVISPIAPHSLTFRPIVDSALRTYRFQLRSAGGRTAVVVDGRQIAEISSSDRVEISPSPVHFQMINVPGVSYYTKLQKKLGWGGHFSSVENSQLEENL